jgi:hypothetical protein
MTDNKNVTLAVLSVSAAILLTILVTMHLTQPAYAAGATIRGGNYIVTTGAFSDRLDIIYVINTAQQKLNAYVIDYHPGADNQIILQDSINLKQAFAAK